MFSTTLGGPESRPLELPDQGEILGDLSFVGIGDSVERENSKGFSLVHIGPCSDGGRGAS